MSGSARDEERRVSIGVRRAPAVTTSDRKTARLLAAYVQMVAEHWGDITAGRRFGDAMTAVATDTDEPEWNRQQALAALATVGRHLNDPDRERLF